jgi:hypothetical protein
MAATAAPAFTADSGTVAVSVTAQAPPAPCLTVTPGSVDFGTLPFSTDNNASSGLSQGHSSDISFKNCGTADQNLLGSTTPAAGPGGSWTPTAYDGTSPHPCPVVDQFYLALFLPNPSLYLTGTPALVLASGGAPAVYPAGSTTLSRLDILMPCQGSNGAGETKTLTATFTAVVA